MPNTITAYTTFVAGTRAKAQEVNDNFSNHRGDLIPINTNTITASDNSHDLGKSDHRWKDLYISNYIIEGSGQTSGAIPIGTVIQCAFSTTPSNYLPCDGSSVSRTTYAGLFRWMTDGTNTLPCFGYDTSTNFYVPDLRGKFIRGVDGGAGNDPDAGTRTAQWGATAGGLAGSTGDSVGSLQSDAIVNILGWHGGGRDLTDPTTSTGSALYTYGINNSNGPNNGSSSEVNIGFDASRVVDTANDNRPTNTYLKFFIRY